MKYFIFLLFVCFFKQNFVLSQIYYKPAYEGDTLVKYVANDLKSLLEQAVGGNFNVAILPNNFQKKGIILNADSNYVKDRIQACNIESDGSSFVVFTAKYANGIRYGVYEYLDRLGFRFYLPDSHWNIIPKLASPYQKINQIVEPLTEIREYALTGGYAPFMMDSTLKNWNDWYIWMYRNNMIGEYAISGHNDWDLNSIPEMADNPCYIAEYNNSSTWTYGSVPNVYNKKAVELWSNHLTKTWKYFRSTTRDPYYRALQGIEVPDAALWGNTNSLGCLSGAYESPTDQNFRLANAVTEFMLDSIPEAQTLCFAYFMHADTPSFNLHNRLHVSIAQGYQPYTSNIGMINRWKKKLGNLNNVSEYTYFNMPYGGQLPYFDKDYMIYAHNRNRIFGMEGITYETGVSKFSTGLWLRSFNRKLNTDRNIDSTLNDFYTTMFGKAATPISKLFDTWTNNAQYTSGDFAPDNVYRFPHYLDLLEQASNLESSPIIQKRIGELKAYMHYLILEYKYRKGYSNYTDSIQAAENLCIYLAKTTDRKIVNHYYQMFLVANEMYSYAPSFYDKWNPSTTSKDPVWATIKPISDVEIENDFQGDRTEFPSFTTYSFSTNQQVIPTLKDKGFGYKDTIHVKHMNTSQPWFWQTEIYAHHPGSIKVIFDSLENKSGTQEDVTYSFVLDSKNQLHSQEVSIKSSESTKGEFYLTIPESGYYMFQVSKSTWGGGNFEYVTNNNLFFRNSPQIPLFNEFYKDIENAPSYFYVPKDVKRVYFSMSNRCSGSYCMPIEELNVYVQLYRPDSSRVEFKVSANDSSLLYFDVEDQFSDNFWQVYSPQIGNSLVFSNISNSFYFLDKTITLNVKELANDFKLYPNPTSGKFSVFSEKLNNSTQLRVYDLSGRERLSTILENGFIELDLSAFAKGVYVVELRTDFGEKTSKKIILN